MDNTTDNLAQVTPGWEQVCGLSAPVPNGGVYSLSDVRSSATPSSNTGSPHTTPTLIDWCSFSFPRDTTLEHVLTTLSPEGAGQVTTDGGEGGWSALDRGGMGYRKCHVRGHIRVYHDGNEDMGVHVAISGQGCRQLEAERGWSAEGEWRGFLKSLRSQGCKVTRLDVAMDDKGDDHILNLDTIREAVEKDAVTSKFRRFSENASRRLGRPRKNDPADPTEGRSFYFGERKSSLMFVRIYDKAKEQLLPEGIHWIRVELCARGVNADALAENFCEWGSIIFPKLMNYYLTFRVPSDTDTNPSRWPVAGWWEAFLGSVEKQGLSLPAVVRTVDKVFHWVRHQVAPSLAVLVAAEGGLAVLERFVSEGATRLSKVHESMLTAYWSTLPAPAQAENIPQPL